MRRGVEAIGQRGAVAMLVSVMVMATKMLVLLSTRSGYIFFVVNDINVNVDVNVEVVDQMKRKVPRSTSPQ